MTNSELWAVHIIGPDDIIPCASRELAVRNATWGNLSFAARTPTLADDHEPLIYQVPIRWDGTAEQHAAALEVEELKDPRWSDPKAPVLYELMEHILRVRLMDQERTDEAESQAAEVRATH